MESGNELKQFATFWIGGRHVGVNIRDVKEVNSEMKFTPIFHAGEEIKGYVNIRGQIHLVIDLSFLMGFGVTRITETARLVLFKPRVGEFMAVIADKIGDVIRTDDNCIEKYRSDHQNTELCAGICKLKNDILLILDAGKILSAVEKFEKSECFKKSDL